MEQRKSLADRTAVLVVIIVLVLCEILSKSKVHGNKIDSFYLNGAVASDAKVCSDIGVQAMKENGTAVDAAIASMFCLGLIHPHSSGIGGGGYMLVYHYSTKEAKFYDFRETAPDASTVNMFANKVQESRKGKQEVPLVQV